MNSSDKREELVQKVEFNNDEEFGLESCDLEKAREKDPTYWQMLGHFLKLAIPCIITNVFSYAVMTVNTIFAGRFTEDSAAKLAGVGLGSMILGMFCRLVLAGVNCA